MTAIAEILKPSTFFFQNKQTGDLAYENGNPDRYTRFSYKWKRITRAEYDRKKAQQEADAKRLSAMHGKHAGATIHIFGNGPSLNEFAAKQDWEKKLTFGVNAAGHCINSLSYWCSVDNMWIKDGRTAHDWIVGWLKTVKGKTVTFIRRDSYAERNLYRLPLLNDGQPVWTPDFIFAYNPNPQRLDHERPLTTGLAAGVFHSLSSVHAAMDIARHLGVARMILWGIDYKDRAHSYSGGEQIKNDLKDNPGKPWACFGEITNGFKRVQEACRGAVEILNANPDSALKVFPLIEPAEAFGL